MLNNYSPPPSAPRLRHSSLMSQGEKRLLKKNQISQVLITKYVGVPHSRTKSFSLSQHLSQIPLHLPLSPSAQAKNDPEEFCWSSRDQLMEKGPFLPLSQCPGRWALIPVQLSESRLSKFILVSIFIVPPQINTMQKH